MIHLELVRDLSAISLVQRLKRFLKRRRLTKLMLSVNGETFKADQLKTFNTRIGLFGDSNPRPLGLVDNLNDLSALLNDV